MCIPQLLNASLKGEATREQLIDQHPKGILIACRDHLSLPLLWRHVLGSAANVEATDSRLRDGLRETEVGHQHGWRSIQGTADEDIGRFDIAVHDALVMGVLQGSGNLAHQARRVFQGEHVVVRPLLEPGRQ